jgi:hypothetical protein
MDPNQPGQPTPDSTPATPPAAPGWGAPPPAAPNAPAWGAPPPAAPNAPGWGAPPPAAPNAPGWGAPPPAAPTDPGWAAPPTWATTPPAASGSGSVVGRIAGSVLGRVIAFIVVAAVIAGGFFLFNKLTGADHTGQVIYTTADQSGNSNCSTSNLVTSVKTGTHVWAVYMWTHRLSADQSVVEEDFLNGSSLGKYNLPSDKTSDADCLSVLDDLSTSFTAPGTYEIKLTVGSEVVADGTLKVTP